MVPTYIKIQTRSCKIFCSTQRIINIVAFFRWICENCGEDKLTSASHVMRLLLKVEADINQSDALQKNEVCCSIIYTFSQSKWAKILKKVQSMFQYF